MKKKKRKGQKLCSNYLLIVFFYQLGFVPNEVKNDIIKFPRFKIEPVKKEARKNYEEPNGFRRRPLDDDDDDETRKASKNYAKRYQFRVRVLKSRGTSETAMNVIGCYSFFLSFFLSRLFLLVALF